MNLAVWLDQTGRQSPSAPALFCGESQIADYAAFRDRAARIAGWLRDSHGVQAGDRVALFMGNSCAYLECLYGIWWAGAVAVPINAKLHRKEAAWIIGNAGASLVFTCGTNAAELDHSDIAGDMPHIVELGQPVHEGIDAATAITEPVARTMDDIAWLFYTSGTTGRPKGVMLTNANLIAMSVSYTCDVDSVNLADCALYAAPISHGAGLYSMIHVRQGSRHCVPESGAFDPTEIFALAPKLGRVSLFAAPTMVTRLVKHAKANRDAGDGIRTIVYGGGPMYLSDIKEALGVLGQRFVQIYGQGESPMTITALKRSEHEDFDRPDRAARLASVGAASSVVEVRVVGVDGALCPAGEPGEVEVRGMTVMKGYWQNEEATRLTLADGWLMTGDIGRMDADGYLTLTDRSRDLIISGGVNIYPREVEEVLLQHPSVREVAVVGQQVPDWGENVVAFVVPNAGFSLSVDELHAFCTNNIARFKRPKKYFFTEVLPKNNYGKILKTELRDMLRQS